MPTIGLNLIQLTEQSCLPIGTNVSVTIKRRDQARDAAPQTLVFTIHRQSEFQRLQQFTARGSGWGDAAALCHLPSGNTEGRSSRGAGEVDGVRRMSKWQR